MSMQTVKNGRSGLSSPITIKRRVIQWASLIIFIGLQLIDSPTSLALLTKIARWKNWIMLTIIAAILVLAGIGIWSAKRPFPPELAGFQVLGIAAVSSMIVITYRTTRSTSLNATLHRTKWLVVWAILHGLNAIQILTHPANRKVVLKGLAAIILLTAAIWYRESILQMAALLQNQEAVVAYLNQFGPLAPLVLSVALVLQVFIAAIPGHILMLGGGYVYGFWTIFAISIVTTVGASQMAFLLAKWAGRPWVERLAPRQVLDKWNDAAHENGMVFFMFAFMLPIFPADILNYVAGLSSISGKQFFVANLFGRLPGLVLLSYLGANGLSLTPQLGLIVTAVGMGMFAGWYYLFVHQM